MKKHPKNGLTYDDWRIRIGGWGLPDPLKMGLYKQTRRPLPAEEEDERKKHIIKLYEDGTPLSWIAKLYRLHRSQVWRIVHNKPNH